MIYIHIPFCQSFCIYCDFYSESHPKQEDFQSYERALIQEIRSRKEEIRICAKEGKNTLYIGGGTPSVLPLSFFGAVLDELRSIGLTTDFDDFSVEVNPEDIIQKGEDYVKGLLSLGANRISMGVQSFNDNILKWMNRRHDSQTAEKAFHILRQSGVENISIDLIFGLSHLTEDKWRETIFRAIQIGGDNRKPEHISAYQLSIEEGSALACLVNKGKYTEADPDRCAHQYSILCEELANAGYEHYEISNYALPTKAAMHNSAYWEHNSYVGLGPGAHSFSFLKGEYKRAWNESSLYGYIKSAETGDFGAVSDFEILDPEQVKIEKLMLGFRTSKGLAPSFLKEVVDNQVLDSYLKRGILVENADGNLRLREDQFFVSDAILRELI